MVDKNQQLEKFQKKLWNMVDELRGNIMSNEFKYYVFGIVFYRYLSENLEREAGHILLKYELQYKEAWKIEEVRKSLKEELISQIGYVLEPDYLFSTMIEEIEKVATGKFNLEYFSEGINSLIDSTIGENSEETFQNIFEDMDLSSKFLGKTIEEKSQTITNILILVSEIDTGQDELGENILGEIYEFLIGEFASHYGRSCKVFYTPKEVSEILAKIVTLGKDEIKDVYDPTCGSGSLLLRVGEEVKIDKYYGQELNPTTYNLARMNMLIHGVDYSKFDIKNEDSIEEPQHMGMKFETIVANPPYSIKWSSDKKFEKDDRFLDYAKLAPKSQADYVFVQHMIHHLSDTGTMIVVLPHGVLFRGGREKNIRENLVADKNYLDAVIGLPSNLFYDTGISTAILIYKKYRKPNDSIFFIDASRGFSRAGNKNILREDDINRIVETYAKREEIDKYSNNIKLEEIEDNDYNLNISRYVDTFEPEPKVNIKEVEKRILEIDEEIEEIDKELKEYLEKYDKRIKSKL